MSLTVASLCSGYGGAEMALTLAGWTHRLAFVADPDPAASKLLAHHHPNVPNLGDITTVDWSRLERVDILTAGFPCTDISCAGRRAGLGEGTRSGVWSHVAKGIDVLRPRLVLLENVAALLSTPANRSTNGATADGDVEPGPAGLGGGPDGPLLRAAGAVLGDLSDLGYDAVWQVVSAASVGAPHLRKRVFILAWPAADPPRDAWRFGCGPNQRGSSGDLMLPSAVLLFRTPTAQLAVNGGSQHPDKRKAGGHGPTLADEVEHLLPTPTATPYGNNQSPSAGAAVRPSLNSLAANALLPTPTVADARGSRNATAGRGADASSEWSLGWSLSDVAYADRWGEYGPAIARWEQTTGRPAPDPTEPGSKGQPRLSPAFVEWMQGLPAGYVTAVPGISRNDALKLLGNGIVPLQGASAVTQLAAIVAGLFASGIAA